jgi:dTDP-4-amino-4,6-dideoxygalactose transaminase
MASALREAGIECAAYYSTPLHLQPVFRELGYEPGSLPESEQAAREVLALPLWPGIAVEQQEQVVAAIRSAVSVGAGA